MSLVVLISVLFYPVITLIGLPHALQQFLTALAFFIVIAGVLGLIFVPKCLQLYSNEDAAEIMVSVKKTRGHNSKKPGHGESSGSGSGTLTVSTQMVQLKELLRNKKQTYGEKVALCKTQIEQWRLLRMELDRSGEEDNDGVSASASQSGRSESSYGSEHMPVEEGESVHATYPDEAISGEVNIHDGDTGGGTLGIQPSANKLLAATLKQSNKNGPSVAASKDEMSPRRADQSQKQSFQTPRKADQSQKQPWPTDMDGKEQPV
jgi:hypothetical protein